MGDICIQRLLNDVLVRGGGFERSLVSVENLAQVIMAFLPHSVALASLFCATRTGAITATCGIRS